MQAAAGAPFQDGDHRVAQKTKDDLHNVGEKIKDAGR